eukprot:13864577-Alexandrium_andersonii.AAC.1
MRFYAPALPNSRNALWPDLVLLAMASLLMHVQTREALGIHARDARATVDQNDGLAFALAPATHPYTG